MKKLTEIECKECGQQMEVETEAPDNYYNDGDVLTCPDCKAEACIIADDEGVSVLYHDE